MNLSRRKLIRAAVAASSVLGGHASPQAAATSKPSRTEFPKVEGLTREVAEFILHTVYGDLPADVVELGRKSILDGMGLALCGSVADTGRLSRDYVKALGLASGASTILGSSIKTAARFAAFVNGVGMHADDYDDTQLAVAEDRVYGQYPGINHNLDQATRCASYPWKELAWDQAHCRYLMGLYYGTWPWLREFVNANRLGLPAIKLWAYDHLCLFGWPVPLPTSDDRSFIY